MTARRSTGNEAWPPPSGPLLRPTSALTAAPRSLAVPRHTAPVVLGPPGTPGTPAPVWSPLRVGMGVGGRTICNLGMCVLAT